MDEMILASWPSGIRDTTEFPTVTLSFDVNLRKHLEAFCKMDGVGWNDYTNQAQAGDLEGSASRLRTFRKMYERLGLIYRDNDNIRLSRLGILLSQLEGNLEAFKDAALEDITAVAVDILSRYQLRNPVDDSSLDASCDVLPCICIWRAMMELDCKINYEEMNRVILHVMRMSELAEAIEKIRRARSSYGNYQGTDQAILEEALGPQVHTDQPSARIAPWFSFAGWGGLIIEQSQDQDGYRHISEYAKPFIKKVLDNPPSYFDTSDKDEWLAYYIGSAKDAESNDAADYTVTPLLDNTKDQYSVQELGTILKDMYQNAGEGMQVCSIHVFGIKYGKVITENGYKSAEIIRASGINDSYNTELSKALNIYKSLVANSFGVIISDKYGRVTEEPKGLRKTGAENVLLYGVPGSGKSHYIKTRYCADPRRMERVVFHPDYTYSDFVGQIMPRVKNSVLTYEFTPGPFTKILSAAYHDPQNYYYLIIEEINRGNAPAIFGEVFQLLDRKTEGPYPAKEVGESEYGITNFDIAEAVYGDSTRQVVLPSNLWILATMNTADQNVFTLDTAFQRRWIMRLIDNDVRKATHANTNISGSSISWGTFAAVVNDLILEANADVSSSEDKRLGAYFTGIRELQVDRFPEKVLKYLWDDALKMNRDVFFNDGMKSLEHVIEVFKRTDDDRVKAVARFDVYSKMLSEMQKRGVGAIEKVEGSAIENE